VDIILPVIVLGALGAIFGLWLSFAQKLFFVQKDPHIEGVVSLLPGSNCGACGKAGCYGLAEALAKGDVKTIACPVAPEEKKSEIAGILGIKMKEEVKQVAAIICGGGTKCSDKFIYDGPKDCNIANLLMSGPKACDYACVGFGSCVDACLFGAMKMGPDGLPKIDDEKCTG